MKTDYTLEWLDFWNYELTKKIKELKEKLEKKKKIHEGLPVGVDNEYDTE